MFSKIKRLPWRVVIPWTLFAVAAATAVFFFLRYNDLKTEADERAEAQAVARDFVEALTNFSYQTIEDDVAQIRSFAVGDFSEELDVFFGPDGIEAIPQAEAVSEGQILSLFVQAVDADEASVFAVVDETITNAAASEPTTDTLRLEVGLIETEQGWKVNRVEVYQSPG
ncbi:MAG: hypothetical protein ACLGHL_09505, partial [Actinomycetota bacterium]